MSRQKRGMINSKSVGGGIITFLESVLERRFSEAEKALDLIRNKRFGGHEFKAGYLNALEGILLSVRSGDPRDFINRARFDEKTIEKYKRDFSALARNGIHEQFDMGHMSAWLDFLRYRDNKLKICATKSVQNK